MKVLNIGAGPPQTPIPAYYDDCDVVRLDTEAENEPDLLMDALDLGELDAGQFDAAYCSHILEHIYPMDLGRFLSGIRHVLTDNGFAEFRVPDGLAACRTAVEAGTLDAFCYNSPAGPVTAWDMLYGWLPFQMRFGHAMSHHSAYSAQSLAATLNGFGFPLVYTTTGYFELRAVGCKAQLDAEIMERIGISDGKSSTVHPNPGAADVGAVRLIRPVAGEALRIGPRPGDNDSPTSPAARGRGAVLPSAESVRRRLRLPVVH